MLTVRPLGESKEGCSWPPICGGGFQRGLFSVGTPACLALCPELLHGNTSVGPILFPEGLGLRDTDGSLRSHIAEPAFCPRSVMLLCCQGRPQSQNIRDGTCMQCVQYRCTSGCRSHGKVRGDPVEKGEPGFMLWVLYLKMVSMDLEDLHKVTRGSNHFPLSSSRASPSWR